MAAVSLTCRRYDLGLIPGGCLGVGPRDVNAAPEVGTVVGADAGALDVADEASLPADSDLAGNFHAAVNAAEYDNFAGSDIGLHFAVRVDGEQAFNSPPALAFSRTLTAID